MGDEAEVRVMLLQAKVTQTTSRPKPLETWCLGQTPLPDSGGIHRAHTLILNFWPPD